MKYFTCITRFILINVLKISVKLYFIYYVGCSLVANRYNFPVCKKREKIFLILNAEEIFLTCHVFRRQCLKPIQAEHDKKEREREKGGRKTKKIRFMN